MRLLSLSLRTAPRAVRWSAICFIALCLLYVITIPGFIGITVGERGAGGIGGGGIGITWGRPADTGYHPKPAFHIKPRGWSVHPWTWDDDRANQMAGAPLWPLLLALLLPAALPTCRIGRRRCRGLCLACGYARGALDRCPECGT